MQPGQTPNLLQPVVGPALSSLTGFIMVFLLVFFVPPIIITGILRTHYREQILKRFPELRGYVLQVVFILWWLFASLVLLPGLFATMMHP